ncbi:hypothetical protein [Phaeocystidibacter luteus]|uniref:Uncharacterized protein n=1 Tax=Phaeocystidibacter luteus TaxID=911197 RepID=A0A6N6RDN5_9FLAO|nr:hypothetical protein [Phaeocystidibacter luteus]KAB2807340.1 hypothetical protein F8C67_12235 [Phaeocystidibacter luteus]
MTRYLLFISLVALTQCSNNRTPVSGAATSTQDSTVVHQGEHWFLDSSNFKYHELSLFSTESLDKSGLKKIDRSFHQKILTQIEGFNFDYHPSNENYFMSIQNDIHDFKCVVVSLNYGVCYDGVFLLLIDSTGKVVNYFPLTEFYSSCDLSTETTTEFESSSKFRMKKVTTEAGFTDYITELEFVGEIDVEGQIDTLEVLRNEEYEI